MPTIISNGSALAIRKPTFSEFDFSIQAIEQVVILIQGETSTVTQGDSVVLSSTESLIENSFAVSIPQTAGGPQTLTVTVSGAGSLSNGTLSRVTDGECRILVSHPWLTKYLDLVFYQQASSASRVWQSWVAGSLGPSITQTTSISLPAWTGGGYLGFTAISPRHAIGCEHGGGMAPTLTIGGITRNLLATEFVGPSNATDNWKSDLCVGLYDGDFPSFAKVFPSTLYSYLTSLDIKSVPVVVCNQYGSKIQRLTSTVSANSKIQLKKISQSDTDIVGGDSGHPCWMVIGSEPVLLGTLTYGPIGIITTIHDQITEINAAMTSLGGGYQLTTVDLSGFNYYG